MDNGTLMFRTACRNFLKGMVTKLVEPYGRLENDPVLYQHLSEDWEYSVSVKYFSLTMDVNCF